MMKEEKGFTMVEIIVTLTVFVMLASVSVYGVLSWQDYADRRRQEEYAQTIYLAAQQELAGYLSKGLMNELFEENLVGEAGYCLARAERNDYSLLMAGGRTVSDTSDIVFRLIGDRIGNAEVLNGYIELCYDQEGRLLGVYYCDKEDRLNFMGFYGDIEVMGGRI